MMTVAASFTALLLVTMMFTSFALNRSAGLQHENPVASDPMVAGDCVTTTVVLHGLTVGVVVTALHYVMIAGVDDESLKSSAVATS